MRLLFGAGFLFVLLGSTLLAQTAYMSLPQAVAVKPMRFEVAPIRPSPPGRDRWRMEFILDGFRANGVSLRQVIQEAYGIYEEDRLSGDPMWLPIQKFDIQAKMSSDDVAALKALSLGQRRAMLQTLLEERTHLRLHHEIVPLPVYELMVAKRGPKFRESSAQQLRQADIKGYQGSVLQSYNGGLEVQEFSMPALALSLYRVLGRTVVDKTGLTGRYDFSLRWTPDNLSDETNAEWPSILTAVEEQLGLKLESARFPVDTLVVDQIEMPSEN
jgi:uncharacterized protein (TIGR03435 family)